MIFNMMHARVKKILESSACRVYVADEETTKHNLPPLIFNIGPQLLPAMNLVMTEEGFSCTLSVRGQPTPISVPWSHVRKVEPFTNPYGGGGGTRLVNAS